MKRKYLSFLGSTDYLACHYTYEGEDATLSRFVQTAIYEHSYEPRENSEFVVFATDIAKERNWFSRLDKDDRNTEGLKDAFARVAPNLRVKIVSISDTQDEEDNWEIFDKIVAEINEGDEIYFDITHGFRSFPLIALIVLNYARLVKKAEIGKIMYGCFEHLGPAYKVKNMPEEERLAPIIDLTNMVTLLDWTNGVDSFMRNGDTSIIRQLTHTEKNRYYQKNSKSVTKEMKNEALQLDKFAKQLDAVSQSFETCRGNTISKEIEKLKDEIENVKRNNAGQIKPLVPLVGQVEQKLNGFNGAIAMDTFNVVMWCIEHHLIQQGYTFLQENIFTVVLKVNGFDPENKNMRSDVSSALNIIAQNIPHHKWRARNRMVLKQLIEFLNEHKADLKSFGALTDYRNNINHAAMNKKNIMYNKFSIKLGELAKGFRPFFEKMEEKIEQQSIVSQ